MATKCSTGMQWPSVFRGQWTRAKWSWGFSVEVLQTFDLIGQLFAKALNKKKCCIFDAVLHISFSAFSFLCRQTVNPQRRRWQVLRAIVLAANNLSTRFRRASNCHPGTNMKILCIMHGWHKWHGCPL